MTAQNPLFRLAAIAALALTTVTVVGALSVRAQEPEAVSEAASSPVYATSSTLSAAVRLLEAGDSDAAAKALKAIAPTGLSAAERTRWTTAARTAAVRTGDAAWLKVINDTLGAADGLAYEDAGLYLIQTATGYLNAGDYPRAQEFLNHFRRDFARFSERDRRRWLAVSARLARLTGDAVSERKHLTELVQYPGMWAMLSCQTCHANPADPKRLPLLDVRDWWPGVRYGALLRQSGEAESVRDQLRERLRKYPNDNGARLRLAYVLRALGKQAEADDTLRYFPWAKFPERTGVEPVRIGAYP
jgi:tetratricopeptide (TPR) repeat protein